MNFDLSDEQRMLDDSLARLLADHADFETRRRLSSRAPGWSPELWAEFARLGLLALPFDEKQGGIGGGPVDTMLVMRQLGRALSAEPFLETCVLAPVLLSEDGGGVVTALRGDIMEGRAICTVAARQESADLVQAASTGGEWRLTGNASLVPWGGEADWLILPAETGKGLALFLIEGERAGVTRRGYPTQDGRRSAKITFKDAVAQRLAASDAGGLLDRARATALAAICAEAVGAMESCLEQTVEYLRTRQQFGTVIGKFQALQHQAADMVIALEQARSMAFFAAMNCEQADAALRERALSAAKVQINRSARSIGQAAIQLHGGIGMTMELAIGHYFKRLTMIELSFGDLDHHLDRLAAAGGLAA
ncbi:acyl-CoA dehydrogenase family protein [Aquamicrobium sp. LC103]|uniref:acyl-CoA dehydrogenase family protein n=1 Tax=Aquamicrobium sp. LC103 TaxID=1120658 RepID=UPI00063EB24B|nr:acyl-CoA dehydrogenase family protein [Aquamicrobium sp. LC103]TKT78195.1 acyl-CoA dehydrogenase [Aquamicrobium sp. LC103]